MSEVKCIVAGEECGAKNCADHCVAQEIKDLADGLGDGVTFSIEAAKDLAQVPKMFRKMAVKTILKGAQKEGLAVVDRDFANKYKP